MRIVKEQDEEIKGFLDIKKAIYYDFRCVISRIEGGLICVSREDSPPSKRQANWMKVILYRTASKEFGRNKFAIEKGTDEHFYLIANEKNTDKTNRKNRKSKRQS